MRNLFLGLILGGTSLFTAASNAAIHFPANSGVIYNYGHIDLSHAKIDVQMVCDDFLGQWVGTSEVISTAVNRDGTFQFNSATLRCSKGSPAHVNYILIAGSEPIAQLGTIAAYKDMKFPTEFSLFEVKPFLAALQLANGMAVADWLKLPENQGKTFYYELQRSFLRQSADEMSFYLPETFSPIEITASNRIEVPGVRFAIPRKLRESDQLKWHVNIWYRGNSGYYEGSRHSVDVSAGVLDAVPVEIVNPVVQ